MKVLLGLLFTTSLSSASQSKLDSLNGHLADVAQKGASLMHYSYSDDFWFNGDIGKDCKLMSGRNVFEQFKQIAKEVDPELAENVKGHVRLGAYEYLQDNLGHHTYYWCSQTTTEFQAIVDRNFAFSKNMNNYRFKITRAYED